MLVLVLDFLPASERKPGAYQRIRNVERVEDEDEDENEHD